jgi:excisionase family DNA binding protein
MKTPLLTSRELSAVLKVSYQTICSWGKAGKLPALRLPDGSWRYRIEEIDAFLIDRTNR